MRMRILRCVSRSTTPLRFRLRVVVATLEAEFAEDDPPSLGGIPVHDTTGEESPEQHPGLAKCGAVAGERKRASR